MNAPAWPWDPLAGLAPVDSGSCAEEAEEQDEEDEGMDENDEREETEETEAEALVDK